MVGCMPKEQEEYIKKIQKHCLESTNMTESEAWEFAFRCWQLGYERKNTGNNWIPCSEETPKYTKYDIEKVWVTMRRKPSTYYFTRRLIWDGSRGAWLFDNGKEVSDIWEIVAWQLIDVPTPYDPERNRNERKNI